MIIRPYQPADLPALVELMNRSYAGFGIDSVVTPDYITMRLDIPQAEAHVLTDAGGALIGGINLTHDSDPPLAFGELLIAPEQRRAAVIHALLAYLEDRVRGFGTQKLYVYLTSAADDVITALLTRGYEYARSSYRMAITLSAPVDTPAPPAGIEIRRFDRDRDAHAAYAAYEASFAEHFGFVPESFDEWARRVLNYPGDDNALWLMAWDGDQIVGFSTNRPAGGNKPRMLWVGSLGVIETHRKRGIGAALLMHTFRLAQVSGYTQVGLGVDASNRTGAVRLYERAGMSVYLEFVNYVKAI
jgi:mycothiol synthase